MLNKAIAKPIAITLIIILILNLVLFAFLRYNLVIFWGIIAVIFLIQFLLFKKRKKDKRF